MPFKTLGLDPSLVQATRNMRYVQPTAIQEAAIPPILAGRDLLATAQTGTGKTAAYLLPILHRLLNLPRRTTQVLVITPTRELAQQIDEVFLGLAYHTPLRVGVLVGGAAMGPQEKALRAGVEVLVATPGRLLDHMRQNQPRLRPRTHPRSGRGRPNARYGLFARPEAHPFAPAGAPPDPADLRHHAAGDRSVGTRYPARSGPDRHRAPKCPCRGYHTGSLSRAGATQDGPPALPPASYGNALGIGVHPDEALELGTWHGSSRPMASGSVSCIATSHSLSGTRPWKRFAGATIRCLWQPISRRGAWMWNTSLTSSVMTYPRCPTTMSTGSAARPEREPRATPG